MKNGNHRRNLTRLSTVFVISVFLLAVAALAIPFHSARSSSLPAHGYSQPSANTGSPAKVGKTASLAVSRPAIPASWAPIFKPLLPTPQPSPEGIATFNSDCITPQSDFFLGDVVCAKATGVPVTLFPWLVLWVDPVGFVRQSDNASTDEATEYRYTIPSTATSTVNGQTVDNRGTWRVNLTRSNGAVRQTARFTVHEAANPVADVFIQKAVHSASGSVPSGDNISFTLVVENAGPDSAAGVHLIDSIPDGGTLVQFTQNSGPQCVAVGDGPANDCIMAALTNGDRAEFTAIYNTGSAATGDYVTSATVSTTTTDPNLGNNTATAQYTVTASNGNATCQLICPDNITTSANTTEGGQRGAHVNYDPPVTSGDCGSVSSVPASGSFFPVGTTVVNATSETGGGACSFTVTVEDHGSVASITCPSDQTADANSDCEANVPVGSPTTSGDNVTVFASRSDGQPMFDCDANGNCTRRSSDAPFPAGVTTITWFAYSHDVAGPYTTPGTPNPGGDTFEEQHRTSNASCTQRVTVNDVTPPNIAATDQTLPADANCQAVVPDYSTTVSDNCACSNSDTSESCVGHPHFTVTQNPAPGTVVGPGQYPVVITANDNSSNNNGAGNTSEKTITLTVADVTAPVITCPASITRSNDPGTCSAVVNPGTATATDNCDTTPTITGTRSDNQPLNAPYPNGTTTITWTATDDANNSSSCQQTVTVNDTESPTISCPGNITRNNDPGACGAVVTYTTPVGSDNCPGATTAQTAGLPSGSTFPVGTTTNTFEVTDTSGNKTSCSFTVTVNDVENPTISCPASQTLEPTCPSGAVATWTAPVGTDNCPGAVTTRTGPAPGSVFPIGTTTVTYTVNDAHGHSASCNFTITVKTPQATIQDMINAVNATSLNGSQKQGLINKLQQALSFINSGDYASACDRLASFKDKVEGYISHGDLSTAQGQPLINSAVHIRNTLGCTNNPCT